MARKPTGNDPQTEARRAFGGLLDSLLERGTRPNGVFLRWKKGIFAAAVGISERTLTNWLNGSTPSPGLKKIEEVLFGLDDNPIHQNDRKALRLAYEQAFGGAPRVLGPQTLINDPGLCLGRDDKVARLVATLLTTSRGAACLILGDAGHGKTTLTEKVGVHPDIVARFGDRRWFVALEEADNAGSALAKIAAAIGLESAAPLGAVQARLAEKPGLIVLDNLETPLHADDRATEALLCNLVSVSGAAVLASLRGRETVAGVPWAEQLWVDPLAAEVARMMFLSIARNIREDDPDLAYFLDELDGVPLAIRLVARRASTRRDLGDLRKEWEKKGALLAKEAGGEGTRRDSLVGSVEFSLASRRLRAEGRLLFALLGQSPGGLSLDDLDVLLEGAGDDAADQLRQVGLLRETSGRVSLLAPIRDVARRRHEPTDAALTYWRRHFLSIVGGEGAKIDKAGGGAAIARLAPEMSNIGAAILASADTPEARREAIGVLDSFGLAMRRTGISGGAALDTFMEVCAREGEAIGQAKGLIARAGWAYMRSMNDASRADFNSALGLMGEDGEPELRASCFRGLADIARMRYEHETARELYEAARALHQRAGGLTGEANCLRGLAEIARMRYEHEKARGLYEAARALHQRADGLAGEADCLRGLAEIARMRDENDTARGLYEAARALHQRAGGLTGEAGCLSGLAEIARMRDENEKARGLFEAARALYQRAGGLTGEADCLWGLADIARMQSDHETARGLFEAARALYQRAGGLTGEADCLWGLAEIARMQSDHETARGLYEAARALYQRAGRLTGEAHCLRGLANIARMQSDHETARGLYEAARALYQRAGRLTGEADCLWGLAEIARMQSDHETARGLYEAARALYQRAGGLTGEADCLRGLADIARMRDEHETARGLYEAARALYQRAGRLTGEADCLWGLAEIARMQSDHETARGLYEAARALYQRAGDMTGVARCNIGISRLR